MSSRHGRVLALVLVWSLLCSFVPFPPPLDAGFNDPLPRAQPQVASDATPTPTPHVIPADDRPVADDPFQTPPPAMGTLPYGFPGTPPEIPALTIDPAPRGADAVLTGDPQPVGDPPPPVPGAPPLTVAPLPDTVSDPVRPTLALDVDVGRGPLLVGATVPFTLTLANHGRAPATDVTVTLPQPEATVRSDTPLAATRAGTPTGWFWPLGTLDPGGSIILTGTLIIERLPTGAALALRPQVAAATITPFSMLGGAVIRDTAQRSATDFTVGRGATLVVPASALTVAVPADGARRDLTLSARPLPDDAARTTPSMPGGFGAFVLEARDQVGAEVEHFDRALTLAVQYTPEQLDVLRIAESDLTIVWLNEASGRWEAQPTTIDPTTGTASTTVDHFSVFALTDGSSPSTAFIPGLKGWQVSSLTGAASFNMPIQLPSGPGGLTPQLALTYSSGGQDGQYRYPYRQGGWAGLGWDLSTGFIGLSKVDGPSTDYYSLALNGRSFDIVRGSLLPGWNVSDNHLEGWYWHATDEQFWRIRYQGANNSGQWVVWTPDGTRYTFAERALWGWGNCPSPTIEPHKWMLSSVQDPHGNLITYRYARLQAPHSCATVDVDLWPTEITWGRNVNVSGSVDRYRVEFVSSPRRSDGTDNWSDAEDMAWDWSGAQFGGAGGAPRQTRKLTALRVWSMPGSSWSLVREYRFGYDFSLYSDDSVCQTGPCSDTTGVFGPNPTSRKLTLRSVQLVGSNGSSALPPMTFSYHTWRGTSKRAAGGWNRLASVDNGQGGVLSYTYANIAQVRMDEGWGHYNLFFNRHRVIEERRSDGRGTTVLTRFTYGAPMVNNLGTNNGGRGPNPFPNSATLVWAWKNNLLGALVTKAEQEFRGHLDVTEITHDGATSGYPILRQIKREFWMGDVGCTPTSATTGDACFVTLRNREAIKGRAWRTTTLNGGNAVIQEVWDYYATRAPAFAADVDMTAQPQRGLWRSFTPLTMRETFQVDSGYRLRRATAYDYDTTNLAGGQFGNQSVVNEYAEQTLIRQTMHFYTSSVAEGGAYLGDRRWGTYTWDANWNSLAYTTFFYDGTQTQGGIGTRGLLTRTSAFANLPASVVAGTTVQSQDTTFTYDAFANRLTETTYSSYGSGTFTGSAWTFSAPGSGSSARTTTTGYDDPATSTVNESYSGLPTSVTNAKNQTETGAYDYVLGTLIRVRDANIPANTTTAAYDAFGRMWRLVRPGDSDANPTAVITYLDWERPVRYVVQRRATTVGGDAYQEIATFYDGLGQLIQTKRESLPWSAQNNISDSQYDALGRVRVQSQPRLVNQSGDAFWQYTAPGTLYRPTSTTYDALDRPLLTTAPDGSVTDQRYTLWPVNNILRAHHDTILPNRTRTQRQSDAMGRLVAVDEITGNCGTYFGYACSGQYTANWASGAVTSYQYDALDRLIGVTDSAGNATTIWYDSLGRKTSMRDPSMGQWWYYYDTWGNLTGQIDGRGLTSWRSYDALNRLVHQTPAYQIIDRFDAQNSTFSWSAYQTVPFNDGGNNVVRSVGANSWASTFGRTSRQLPHGSSILLRFKVDRTDTEAHFSLQAEGSTFRRFDVVAGSGGLYVKYAPGDGSWQWPGSLLSTIQPHTWYVLRITVDDQLGMRATVFQENNHAVSGTRAVPMTTGQTWGFQHWIYRGTADLDDYHEYVDADRYFYYDESGVPNGVGQRTATCVQDYHWNCTLLQRWEYDTRGRVSRTTQQVQGLGGLLGLRTTYDSADRVITQQYEPTSEVVTTTYDIAGRPTSLCIGVGGCYVSNATWTALDQPDTWTLGSGITRQASYTSPLAQLQSLSVTWGSTALLSRSYTYDVVGNIQSMTDNTPGSPFGAQTFGYDPRDRLTSWSGSGVWEGYSYSAHGNLLSKAGVGYTYPAAGQPRPYAPTAVGGQSYSYDANGNLLSGGGRTFVWNAINKPASISSGGVTEYYRYDADGNRAVRTRSGQTTVYFAGVWEDTLGVAARKLYSFNGQIVAQRTGSNTPAYMHGDHLGSVAVTSDHSGGAVQRQFFDPWGTVRSGGTPGVTTNFTGQRRDDTGLLFYNARYYDPAIGRFLSADTVVPGAGALTLTPSDATAAGMWGAGGGGPLNPQELNRYTYALNNPLRYTDPTGHWFESLIDIAAIAYDIYDISQNGLNASNGTSLALNVVSLALPVVPAAGTALVRGADAAVDIARTADTSLSAPQAIVRGRGPGHPLSSPEQPFLVTPDGATLPPNRDYNLVNTQQADTPDWIQIHRTHDHNPYGNPHSHVPRIDSNPVTGQQRVTRVDRATTVADINHADAALRSGALRQRVHRNDRGGPR